MNTQNQDFPDSQPQPAPGSMTLNDEGAVAFAVSDMTRLKRFLIIGTEGGSYYASGVQLTTQSTAALLRCLAHDHRATIAEIVRVSELGLAVSNDYALMALAVAASSTDGPTRLHALEVLHRVARTASHLFFFYSVLSKMRGWSRSLRRAFATWYTSKAPDDLAYQMVKYQERNGVDHGNLLHLSHPVPPTEAHRALFGWATGRVVAEKDGVYLNFERLAWDEQAKTWTPRGKEENVPAYVRGFELAKHAPDDAPTVGRLIEQYHLTREMIPTKWLNSPEVWFKLLSNTPLEALMRNLGNLTRIGVLEDTLTEADVVARLMSSTDIVRSRLHPLKVLVALMTYNRGYGIDKGEDTNRWTPLRNISYALEKAFYLSFRNVLPTNKRYYLALDVSASMTNPPMNRAGGLTPREGSVAMAMTTIRTEPNVIVRGFSHELVNVPITAETGLEDAIEVVKRIRVGGTDCALPMMDALLHKTPVDVFVVYTDSETQVNGISPHDALRMYREKMHIDAKLCVVGMNSNGFTLADPLDLGMMDVVGFDTSFPEILRTFSID